MAKMDDFSQPRREHQSLLKEFYERAPQRSDVASDANVFDIDSGSFRAHEYLQKIISEKSLTELMAKEKEMTGSIRQLDSEMQTLVYENYNKFIVATDTVRKMKSDMVNMEAEMTDLSEKMKSITVFSGTISGQLKQKRDQMVHLSGVHSSLKKLQFLFDLPKKMKLALSNKDYERVVRYHVQTRATLEQYSNNAAFASIKAECATLIAQVITELKAKFRDPSCTTRDLSHFVSLLLQLDERPGDLCDEYLKNIGHKLGDDLQRIAAEIRPPSKDKPADPTAFDILTFVDMGCNTFVSDICLFIANYTALFFDSALEKDVSRASQSDSVETVAMRKLVTFVHELMQRYFNLTKERFSLEREMTDCQLLVRALDRFYRRLQAMNSVMPGVDFSRSAIEIVSLAAQLRTSHYLDNLKSHFSKCLTDLRQAMAGGSFQLSAASSRPALDLADLLKSFNASLLEQLRFVLSSLKSFVTPEVSFAMKSPFRMPFCLQMTREGCVVRFLQHVIGVCRSFVESNVAERASHPPPGVLLLLSRFCLDLETSLISSVLSSVADQFAVDTVDAEALPASIRDRQLDTLTSAGTLGQEARDVGLRLLEHFVAVQGAILSQMIRKSVEARDWLNTIEPRNVRAVMKRIIEDVTLVDTQVGQLYVEGSASKNRGDKGSDSSRQRSGLFVGATSVRSSQWTYPPSFNDSILSNIQKIFAERIEVFAPVEFTRLSVLSAIVRIALKAFVECIRLRTFSRYGLQQVQVDVRYLHNYLWRFVADENVVGFFLDQVVHSAALRCADPVLMEASVVDIICERG